MRLGETKWGKKCGFLSEKSFFPGQDFYLIGIDMPLEQAYCDLFVNKSDGNVYLHRCYETLPYHCILLLLPV